MSDKKKKSAVSINKLMGDFVNSPEGFKLFKATLPSGCANVLMDVWGDKVDGKDFRAGLIAGLLGTIAVRASEKQWNEAFGCEFSGNCCDDPNCECLNLTKAAKTFFVELRAYFIKKTNKADFKNN